MPIYEFHCKACDRHFEELVMASDRGAATRCPKCGSPRVEKLLSMFSSHRASSGMGAISETGSCSSPSSSFS